MQIQLWFKDCSFQSQIHCINFTTSTRSTIMSSIRVTVHTTDQKVSINNLFFFFSARFDLSFIEGFNLAEIIEMMIMCQQDRLSFKNCVRLFFFIIGYFF